MLLVVFPPPPVPGADTPTQQISGPMVRPTIESEQFGSQSMHMLQSLNHWEEHTQARGHRVLLSCRVTLCWAGHSGQGLPHCDALMLRVLLGSAGQLACGQHAAERRGLHVGAVSAIHVPCVKHRIKPTICIVYGGTISRPTVPAISSGVRCRVACECMWCNSI